MSRFAVCLVLAAAAVTGVAACGGAPSAGEHGGTRLSIRNFTFSPSPLKVKVGQVVTVTNADNTDHTATADDGSFDTGRFSDGTRTIKLSRPGSLAYHCSVHDYMRGVIQVGP